jgi:hypothetical protein
MIEKALLAAILLTICLCTIFWLAQTLPYKILDRHKRRTHFPIDATVTAFFISILVIMFSPILFEEVVTQLDEAAARSEMTPLPKERVIVLALEKPMGFHTKYAIRGFLEKAASRDITLKLLFDVKPGERWSETTQDIEEFLANGKYDPNGVIIDSENLPMVPGIHFQHRFTYYRKHHNITNGFLIADYNVGYYNPCALKVPADGFRSEHIDEMVEHWNNVEFPEPIAIKDEARFDAYIKEKQR